MNRRTLLTTALTLSSGRRADFRIRQIKHLSPDTARPFWIKWAASKTHLLAAGNQILLYDLKSGKSASVITLHAGYPSPCAWHPGGWLFATSNQPGNVLIFDRALKKQRQLELGGREIVSAAWSPTGDFFLATSISGQLCVWDTRKYELAYQRPVAAECFAEWSHGGTRVALSSTIGEVLILEAKTWAETTVIKADPLNDYLERSPVAWSLDDSVLYVAHAGEEPKIKGWSVAKQSMISEWDVGEALGLSELQPLTKNAVLLRADETLRVMQGPFTRHLPAVSENFHSHDVDLRGKLVAGVSNDVWLFRVEDRRIERAPCGLKGGACVALSHDGSMMAVGCDDGGIRLYEVTS